MKNEKNNLVKLDAERRDLTINSLFYNLETKQVEDYVGGLKDLKTMTLKTPLDPKKTFMDDPLRMLRVLRFHSRYKGSNIDPSIIQVMKDPDIHKAYTKLSPERASKELRKLMEGVNVVEATSILLDTDLYKPVFGIPETWHPFKMNQKNPHHDLHLMDHTLTVMKHLNDWAIKNNIPKDEKGLLMLSALFHDFGKMDEKIGKPKIKKLEQVDEFGNKKIVEAPDENHWNYIGHEFSSSKFAKDIMTRMGFEPHEKKFVETVSSLHMRPHGFSKSLSYKDLGDFLQKADKYYHYILQHGVADASAKRKDLSEEELAKIRKEREEVIGNIETYRKEMGDRITKTLLDGNEINALVTRLAPELVSKKAMINSKGKQVYYLKYLLDSLLKQQWDRRISTREEAEKFISGQIKSVYSQWKKEQVNKKANNYFSLTKEALIENMNSDPGLQHNEAPNYGVSRYPSVSEAISPFRVGDKVRLRNRGLAFEQTEGRVTKVKNNFVYINWQTGHYKGKMTKHNLLNQEKIASLLEKI